MATASETTSAVTPTTKIAANALPTIRKDLRSPAPASWVAAECSPVKASLNSSPTAL
jgi:hypothetical protein